MAQALSVIDSLSVFQVLVPVIVFMVIFAIAIHKIK